MTKITIILSNTRKNLYPHLIPRETKDNCINVLAILYELISVISISDIDLTKHITWNLVTTYQPPLHFL